VLAFGFLVSIMMNASRYVMLIVLPVWFIATSELMGFLDRVTVVGNRNARYCPACRYDLAGTLAAGVSRCPECGFETAQPTAERRLT